jgi:hypothetical protein
MKILFLLGALANVVLFMWEFKQGAFERSAEAVQQAGQERILLVSELENANRVVSDVDFTALYPADLDPLANNLLTEQLVLEGFPATAPCVALPPASMQSTGDLLLSAEP